MRTRDHSADSSLSLKKAFVRATAVIGVLTLFYTAYLYYDYIPRGPSNAFITPRSTSSSLA